MPLNPTPVFEARLAAKYTGQNANDFNAAISDFTIVAERPGPDLQLGRPAVPGGQPTATSCTTRARSPRSSRTSRTTSRRHGELTSELGLNHRPRPDHKRRPGHRLTAPQPGWRTPAPSVLVQLRRDEDVTLRAVAAGSGTHRPSFSSNSPPCEHQYRRPTPALAMFAAQPPK